MMAVVRGMINRFEHSEASEADTPLALGVALKIAN